MNLPVYLPSDILRYLFGDLGMDIPQEAVEKFWSHAWQYNLPWKELSHCHKHMPIALYGDSAKYSPAGQKITAFFMNIVLWAPRVSRMSRWLLFTVETDMIAGPQTINPLLRPIVEDLISLYNTGLQVGPDDRKFFATCELRGDWEWHVFLFSMRRTWRHDRFCWRCEVDKKNDNNFMDLSDNPKWSETELSQVQFLARIIPSSNVWP